MQSFYDTFSPCAAWLCNCHYANNHFIPFNSLASINQQMNQHFLFWLISTAAQIVFLQLPAPSLETAVGPEQNDGGEDLFREPG